MHYGLILPTKRAGAGPEAILATAQAAERLGWRTLCGDDHVLVPREDGGTYGLIYEIITTLAWLGGQTTRTILQPSVIVVPQRSAIVLAKELATVAALTAGRMVAGVGIGWNIHEYRNLGMEDRFHVRGAYLDETIAPRLHPADPLQRAWNRAWTDYLPTFASDVTGAAYASTQADYEKAVGKIEGPFRKLEEALARRSEGPFFNGAAYSLVDAAYAPFLQRYGFLDRIAPLGKLEAFPNLSAWSEALMARASTHSFAPDVFEGMYRDTVQKRNVWLSRFC